MASKEKKAVPPKLNKYMHPRNPYKTPPSFKKLATKYPEFRAHCSYDVSGKVHLDFKNPKALRALTTCLLHQDYGLNVTIPDDRLVPTLPLRLNYLLWVEDLLTHAAHQDGQQVVVGADIGTGAACVYPLLGARHFGWCMLATESDQLSFTSSLENVKQNALQNQIIMKKVDERTVFKDALDDPETLQQMSACRARGRGRIHMSETLGSCNLSDQLQEEMKDHSESDVTEPAPSLEGTGHIEDENHTEEDEDDRASSYVYDFTMSNPPFFSSEEETDTMAKSKKGRGEPSAAPTGSAHEKVTTGGEVEFIKQMITESQLLRDKVRIFTTLIGTKAHIKEIKSLVEAAKPSSSVFTEFCQGRTMRWGAAWSYNPTVRLGQVKSKKEMATNKPIILLLPRSLMTAYSVPAAWAMLNKWLHTLKVKVRILKKNQYFVSANVKAFKPTWLHQRRKKREERRKEGKQNGVCSDVMLEESVKKSKEEDSTSHKRKAEAEDPDEERLSKKTKTTADESEYTGNWQQVPVVSATHEEPGDDPSHPWAPDTLQDSRAKPEEDQHESRKGGMECVLRCNFHVKQTGGLISIEAFYLDGSGGKDSLNQLVQYMKNQLTRPHV